MNSVALTEIIKTPNNLIFHIIHILHNLHISVNATKISYANLEYTSEGQPSVIYDYQNRVEYDIYLHKSHEVSEPIFSVLFGRSAALQLGSEYFI